MGTEPELAPEWLKSSGNAAGGSTSLHHKDSSSAQSTQSKYHSGNIKKDGPHYLDRSLSSSSRHGSSNNGSTKPSFSSFSRSPWEKKREGSFGSINPHGDERGMKDKLVNFPSIPLHSPRFPKGIECIQTSPDRGKEKYRSRNLWDHNSSYLLPSKLTSRVHKDGLSGSQSLISRKPGEQVPRIVGNSHTTNQKAVFEKDFPTLGTGEKQNVSAIKRHLSPGLSYVVQSLPMSHSRFLDGEKWSSALVEVTHALENNRISHSSLTRGVATAHGSSAAVSSATGLNMAEALSIPAVRVHANPQQPEKSQRLEELAIKQSRQLIPMKSSVPKPLGLPISIDKSKQPKPAFRNTETTMVSGGRIKPDSVRASHAGKFLVLKSGREIIPTGAKDGLSNDSNGSVSSDGRLATAPPTPKSSISHLKSTADKKSAQSLAQSRSEFFKLMRKKASSPPSTSTSCSNSNTEKRKGCEGDISSQSLENRCEEKGFLDVGDCCLSSNGSTYPNEEEAAFLRSLGWDENGGEGGLTEEEINAFYHEYMNGGPSSENAKARHLLQDQMPCQEFTFPTRSSSEYEPEA